ncbi:hypothetical protein ASPTUDRAFT_136964 [Aspergillus tubingensis CBS 134.48]|uniref:Uncharacterized protein n=1 Tax=Aspergillus tubingensis (strain CBS 134.48) TaxID=767770 RepID=A0A1L9NF86_ASPTC|nr:hypothetical protein ASPTUDRAFT_136964 [Aspergillus tubingensis CBS 134.48]
MTGIQPNAQDVRVSRTDPGLDRHDGRTFERITCMHLVCHRTNEGHIAGIPDATHLVIRLSLLDPTADKAARNPKCAWTATTVDASLSIDGKIE